MNKALFLDRDGVLNRVVVRDSFVGSPRTLSEFEVRPEARDLVLDAKKKGYYVIVITNQPDVERGLLKAEELDGMHSRLKELIPIDDIKVCTSGDDLDVRKKPNPGMILEAAEEYKLRLDHSFLVGDGSKDIEAGKRAGIRTILIETPYNKHLHGKADFTISSMQAISQLL